MTQAKNHYIEITGINCWDEAAQYVSRQRNNFGKGDCLIAIRIVDLVTRPEAVEDAEYTGRTEK